MIALLQVPDKYIVVERTDAVDIHFVFVYVDSAAATAASVAAPGASPGLQQQPSPGLLAAAEGLAAGGGGAAAAAAPPAVRQRSPLLFLLLAYVGWMLFVYCSNNPSWRHLLRRHLGLRI